MSAISLIFTSIAFTLCCIVYYLSRRNIDYWKKKKIPYLKPLPFFGNFKDYIFLKKYYPEITSEICRQFPDEPCIGAFFGTDPVLIVKDPELVKSVLTRDFYYFNGREVTNYTHRETATKNLFFTYGDRWKIIRQNLNPIFSSAKMKKIFPLLEKCATTLDTWLAEEVAESLTIDVKNITSSYTMDCIGSCFFGVSTNTMNREPEVNPFKLVGASIFEPSTGLGMKNVWRAMWPAIFYGLRFRLVEPNVIQFFNKLLTDVFKSRQYKPTQRNDFVDLILALHNNQYVKAESISNLKTGGHEETTLQVDDEFMVSNCIVMFAAGFETSSSTLSYTLYELAKNQEAQTKAIQDVDRYWKSHTAVEYECISELPYIEACLDETLRLYPVLGVLTREVMDDYILPTGLRLDKGLRVHIPVYNIHHNPEYFPDPEEYRPERFYGENKSQIRPYTFMPFGEGPRICIGLRFAKMQMLSCLLTVLRRYRVELPADMPRHLQLEPRSITTQPRGIIRLMFIPRTTQTIEPAMYIRR